MPPVNAQSAIEGKLPASERMLQAALRRAVGAKAGVTMLVLHAADLPGVAARPHRAKLARAVLADIAEQVEGEVFRLTNGDLVLMARQPGSKLGQGGLATTLGRLFDHPPEACVRYVSCWPLDQSPGEASTYVASRLAEAADQQAPVLASPPLAASEWPGPLLSAGPIWDLLSRQTAVRLPDIADRRPGALIPLHHALAFSVGMLQARAPMPAVDLDRCMVRHLTTGLEPALLAQLGAGLTRQGDERPAAGRAASFAGLARTAPVFLSLGLRALAAPEFTALLQAGRHAALPGGWLGVELPWIETLSDVGLFARVRAMLLEQQVPWALGGLSHSGLLVGALHRLGADLCKLDWSPSLAAADAGRRQDTNAALEAIGPARIILTAADSEAAVRWGVTRGIRRFQGPHVEAMLAASRMLGCSAAAGCTITQCSQRATAVAGAGRAGCQRLDLLDGAKSEEMRG